MPYITGEGGNDRTPPYFTKPDNKTVENNLAENDT